MCGGRHGGQASASRQRASPRWRSKDPRLSCGRSELTNERPVGKRTDLDTIVECPRNTGSARPHSSSLCEAAPAAAQAPGADTIPLIDLDSLVVSVLREAPWRVGDSPYPISVVGKTELRPGEDRDVPGGGPREPAGCAGSEPVQLRRGGASLHPEASGRAPRSVSAESTSRSTGSRPRSPMASPRSTT